MYDSPTSGLNLEWITPGSSDILLLLKLSSFFSLDPIHFLFKHFNYPEFKKQQQQQTERERERERGTSSN